MRPRLPCLGCVLATVALVALALGPARASVLADRAAAPQPGLVYFEKDGALFAIDPSEGEPARIAAGREPAVSPDGTRLAYLGEAEGVDQLLIADADGTDAEPVYTARGPSDGGFRLGRPAWSPDGMSVAVSDFVDDVAIVEIVPLEPGGTETVAAGLEGIGDTLSWSPDGAALALDQLRSSGGPAVREVVAIDVETGDGAAVEQGAQPSYGPNGDLVFIRGGEPWILKAGETEAELFSPPRADGEPSEFEHRRPAFAPDGSAIVFERKDGTNSWITMAPLGEGWPTRLTSGEGRACCPAWAPRTGPPPALIEIADASSAEGEPLQFTVSIAEAAATDVTVTATTQSGTAAAGGDFVARSADVTIDAGQTAAVFDVVTIDDSADEANETLSVLLSSPRGGLISDDVATGTIIDDDGLKPPVVSVADASALESSDLRFAVSLSAPAATDVSVTATTSTGTAGAADFIATTEVVEIPAGRREADFVVPTADDTLDEAAETLTVTLSSPEGATIGDGSATGTIVDKSRITVATPAPVTEGGTLRFPVRLDHPAASQVTVRLATEDGTAHAPGDYTAQSQTAVVIPAGQILAFFDVVTAGDALDELDERVTARIVGSDGPASLAALTASGTILDDDDPELSIADASILESSALWFTVRLSASPATDVKVTATTSPGTAGATDFTPKTERITIPAGRVEATFLVDTAEDTLDEAAETLTVTLSSPEGATIADGSATGTIVDKSRITVATPAPVTEGGTLRFPVRLDHPAATQVTVRLSTQDGSAQAPGDYASRVDATIVMPAGTTEAFFEVSTAEDFDFDEGDESVTARIVGSHGPASLLAFSASGTIQDKPRPTVRVHPATAVEGTPLRFPVRLSEARPGEVTVTLTTQDESARAPDDYTSTTETVRFPAGQTEKMFTVPTTGNGFDEPDKTVTVRLLSTTNVFMGFPLSATGTITDDDEPLPVVRLDPPTAVEEGGSLRFPLRLDRATPGPVDIHLSTADGTAKTPDDYTAQTLTLVRIPAGGTEGFLQVPTAEDDLAESDETVRADIKSATNVRLSVMNMTATGTIRDGAGPVRMLPGRVLGGRVISGVVRVRPPRGRKYVDLGAAAGLPVGTRVDATNGVIELTSAFGPRPIAFRAQARAQRARFSRGIFTIRQARRSPRVTLQLSGPELRRCGRAGTPVRRLRAEGRGRFVTKGRYAEAGSRNGHWLTEDRCTSTRVKVTRGRVTARDTTRNRTTVVREGNALTVRKSR